TGDRPIVSRLFQTRRGGFEESFVIQNNPYRPSQGAAQFEYELNEPSAVEFRVFTVTGEAVYNRAFRQGENGTFTGVNRIEWDGCNDEGDLVGSGVYIAVIEVASTGEQARMKVAVIR
ncbi:MAG: hypothetical protein AB1744_12890, partial [Candidatus Zixiibacteriota bacterium]